MSRTRARKKRRVAVITGTRAEYGLLESVMEAIRDHRHLDLQLVATGMHLIRKFGFTLDQIRSDGWHIDAVVRMQTGSDDATDQAKGMSRGIAGIARFLEETGTDIVVVLGDRIEAMAAALAAVTTGRMLAHIHGGDLALGDFDDSLRHAITKLAHLHLVATPGARRRVIRMGEDSKRVHLVGAPGLDRLIRLTRSSKRRAHDRGARQALIVYHAMGRSAERECRTMAALLRAVEASGLRRTIVYPNSDRGHTGVLRAIEAHCASSPSGAARAVRSLPRDEYLRALIDADVLVGNSSSGIIEAATAGTAVVNVGRRQHGREAAGRAVIHCDESRQGIQEAVTRALRKRPQQARTTAYGDGRAGARIAACLATASLTAGFTHKTNAY